MSKTTTIWNEEKEQFLKENYAFKTNGNLAKHLGISVPSVKKKAYELGLKKVCAKWKSHTNLTHPGKYFRPSKVKIMRPTSPK